MEKYITPEINERALYDEPVLNDGTYPEVNENDDGFDLSNKYLYDEENPQNEKSVWD